MKFQTNPWTIDIIGYIIDVVCPFLTRIIKKKKKTFEKNYTELTYEIEGKLIYQNVQIAIGSFETFNTLDLPVWFYVLQIRTLTLVQHEQSDMF